LIVYERYGIQSLDHELPSLGIISYLVCLLVSENKNVRTLWGASLTMPLH